MSANKNYKQGKFKPKNPQKYNGDPTNIVYRSSYELKMFHYCDLTENIISYQSEEFWVPYVSPVDKKVHRYFPDMKLKYKDKDGNIRIVVVEIKPAKDLKEPPTNPPNRTKSWAYAVKSWVVNQAKWEACREYCKDRNWEFRIFTEKDLGIQL